MSTYISEWTKEMRLAANEAASLYQELDMLCLMYPENAELVRQRNAVEEILSKLKKEAMRGPIDDIATRRIINCA